MQDLSQINELFFGVILFSADYRKSLNAWLHIEQSQKKVKQILPGGYQKNSGH